MSDFPHKSEFLNKVRCLRRRFGSSKQVAAHLGVSYQTVDRWLRGDFKLENLDVKMWNKVMGGPATTPAAEPESLARSSHGTDLVPLFALGSPGIGQCFDDQGFPLEPGEGSMLLPGRAFIGKEAYALRIVGEIASPRLKDGDIVIVSASKKPKPKGLVVARLKTGEVSVRTYERAGGRVILRSPNPDHPDYILDPGRVDWIKPIVWVKLPD